MPRTLEGIRVVDNTWNLAGPYCTALLGDLGAEVIKIEPPWGDMARGGGAFSRGGVKGQSPYFMWLNRNKKGIVLNLKNENAVKLFKELVKTSDVVVENMRPGAMDRLGIDPGELACKMAWAVKLSRQEEHYCKTFTHGRFTISSAYYRMMVPCPLCSGGGGNGELLVIDNITKEELYFPSMMPHLISAHHFFESPGSSYRVEPEEADAVLEHFSVPEDFVYPRQTQA